MIGQLNQSHMIDLVLHMITICYVEHQGIFPRNLWHAWPAIVAARLGMELVREQFGGALGKISTLWHAWPAIVAAHLGMELAREQLKKQQITLCFT